jgi:hypothetical protein
LPCAGGGPDPGTRPRPRRRSPETGWEWAGRACGTASEKFHKDLG